MQADSRSRYRLSAVIAALVVAAGALIGTWACEEDAPATASQPTPAAAPTAP